MVPSIELVNTGTELLLGQVTNTHLPWLAQELRPLGLRIDRQVTVPDGPMIEEALREALTRGQVVLITGGLGPTSDDITREIAAQLFEQPLMFVDRERDAGDPLCRLQHVGRNRRRILRDGGERARHQAGANASAGEAFDEAAAVDHELLVVHGVAPSCILHRHPFV